MRKEPLITIGTYAIEAFIDFCQRDGTEQFLLVSDENTHTVLGRCVEAAIHQQGWNLITMVLDPRGLHTEDVSVARVLAKYDAQPRLFVAVGSGTVTDIARFSSHRSQNQFVCFPTAVSVDAFTSNITPITIGGLKSSLPSHAPIAIFADMETIANSPPFLTASGMGDLLSKYSSSTDWLLSKLLWDADFSNEIYERAQRCALTGSVAVAGAAAGDVRALQTVLECQFESGQCMADFNNSAPASGGEHHIAHVWEMMFQWEGREGLLHGNGVGVATLLQAAWFEQLRALTKEEAAQRLENFQPADAERQAAELRQYLPLIAEEIIESRPIMLQLSQPEKLAQIKERILQEWEAIQAAAAKVPPAKQLRDWLRQMGAPLNPADLGLSSKQAETGIQYGHYLRERFSMNLLRQMLGWPAAATD